MRLRLFDRVRRLTHRTPLSETGPAASGAQGRHRRAKRRRPAEPVRPTGMTAGSAGSFPGPSPAPEEWFTRGEPTRPGAWPVAPPDGSPVAEVPSAPGTPAVPVLRPSQAHGPSAVRAGSARARIREAPADAVGFGEVARPAPATQAAELARYAAGVPRQPDGGARSSLRAAGAALRTRLPFAAPHSRERPPGADGRRNCGSIERILWRQWDTATPPPAEVIAAVDRLAELPERIKERLTDGLDAIFIGPGGVPELDEMTGLRGVPLPAGRATWDACAGAYGERKIVVGSQASPTPDVMCHEVGHALDDLDSPPGKWQSDSAEFRMLYDQCQPHLASDFHRQPGGLGRKEFFADAFAAIASRQRPALVDMLSGDTRTALRVMLYFNRRYGI